MPSTLVALLLCPLLASPAIAHSAEAVVNHSRIAFTLEEKDLLPENLAFDTKTGDFFVGSTRKGKIVRVKPGCREWEFVKARAHGLWMVIGMKADSAHRVLWVASSGGENLVGWRQGNGNPAGLFEFDLDTGNLLAKYTLEEPGIQHFLNDLVIAPNGDVYVTHMFKAGQVWRLDAKTRTFAPFYSGDANFRDPNGISITPDGKHLYVADASGISVINIADRSRRPLIIPKGVTLGGADGLYLYGHSLVMIQPGLKRVSRCDLDQSGLRITVCEVLEQSHPLFAHPTTGVIVGNTLFYIANSQFESVSSTGSLLPLDQLYEPVVLKLSL